MGQCPLFDESEGRHQAEVSTAEVQTRKKVVEENPDLVRTFPMISEGLNLRMLVSFLLSFRLSAAVKLPTYLLTRRRTKKH